jgi:hypothetical protein
VWKKQIRGQKNCGKGYHFLIIKWIIKPNVTIIVISIIITSPANRMLKENWIITQNRPWKPGDLAQKYHKSLTIGVAAIECIIIYFASIERLQA